MKRRFLLIIICLLALASLTMSFFLEDVVDELYFPNVSFGEQEYEKISSNLSHDEKSTIFKSRNSTVKIFSLMSFDEPPYYSPSISTGTYVIYNSKHYVLTAAHVADDCATMMFIASYDDSSTCKKFAYVDVEMDIMLVELDYELIEKTPVMINTQLNLSKDYSIGEKIYYSGFPNDSGLLTIKGHISGYTYDKFLLQSYAWNGASGSGIFNLNGELIGVLSAIQVSYDGEDFGLIHSIVYAIPIAEINFAKVE